MFFLKELKWLVFSLIFLFTTLSLLASLALFLLIWIDDHRGPDDFTLEVKSWTFKNGNLEYFTRKGGGDTAICTVPADASSTYPVGSKVLVSVNLFFDRCTLEPLSR